MISYVKIQNTKYKLKQNMNKKEKRIRKEKQKNKYNNKKTNRCHYIHYLSRQIWIV